MRGTRKGAINLVEAVPARCAQLLALGLVEAALVPVIEYQRIPRIGMSAEVCVGSKGNVRSVVLATRVDELKDMRTIALDESSRTSAALVKIIFREFLGLEPRWTSCAPGLKQMLSKSDGALIIGDPAMTFPREGLRIFDLASLWREYTGLGFVFAMWMILDKASGAARRLDFTAACREGLAQMEKIIDFYEPMLGLPRNELQAYLSRDITFYLDEELRAGLNLYYKLAHKHGLIPTLKPLRSTGV